MDVKYINPFVHAVINTMETMLGVVPERMTTYLKEDEKAHGDISGIIGFGEANIVGSVALTFPTETAIKVYKLMIGDEVTSLNEEVRDTVGELSNIVAGSAKKEFADMDILYHLSIPTVVVGKDHTVIHKGGMGVVVIPFELDNSPFTMEISMKVNNK